MLSIGDFARLAGVSVRMLRHYDALGLLTPTQVDGSTGYRCYHAAQLDRINRLVAFKDLGFSLTQVAALLDDDVDPGQIRGMLRLRREELATQIASDQARLRHVEQRLRMIEGTSVMSTEYTQTDLPALHLAQFAATIEEGCDVGSVVGPLFGRLDGALRAAGVTPSGPSVGVYSGGADGMTAAAGFVVADTVTDAALGTTGLQISDLPAVPRALVGQYRGNISGIGAAWQELSREVEQQGLTFAGPCREVYLSADLDDPDHWVIDLQQPLA